MSFLKRRFSKSRITPNAQSFNWWESVFSSSDLERFYEIVNVYFLKQQEPFLVQDGFVLLQNKQTKIDLRNLAQVCSGVDKSHWEETISSYFKQLENIKETLPDYIKEKRFDELMQYLAVQLWPAGTLEITENADMVHRKDLEGTISALVLDLPSSIVAVNQSMITSWGKTSQDLFEIGLRNSRERHPPKITEAVLAGDVKAVMLSNDGDFFTATQILFLSDYPICIGKYGAIVCIPIRDIVVCHPVNEKGVTRAIKVFSAVVKDLFERGPGSVSEYLYWYNQGIFESISIEKGYSRGLKEVIKILDG